MEKFQLRAGEDFIRLGQVLKAAGLAESGAEAKEVIQDGQVLVNGETETRRGRKLYKWESYGNQISKAEKLQKLRSVRLEF